MDELNIMLKLTLLMKIWIQFQKSLKLVEFQEKRDKIPLLKVQRNSGKDCY